MTNGPPSSAAGSSKTPVISPPSNTPPTDEFAGAGYSAPFASWPLTQPESIPVISSQQNGSAQMRSYYRDNTYGGQTLMQSRKYQPSVATKEPPIRTPIPATPNVPIARIQTPPPPEPETYQHWDNVIRKFLVCANLIQTLNGLENDMLVLNPEWEQNIIPKALKELQANLQRIFDRVEGKQKAEDIDVDIESINAAEGTDSLDERKVEYVTLATGKPVRSQSSINKSISQFLAKTRARNDASNRAEFLLTLAEKRRKLQEELGPEAAAEVEVSSCARVDAKPIDRDKQMKYDIAKNGEGPLTKTVKNNVTPPVISSASFYASHSSALVQPSPVASSAMFVNDPTLSAKKRKFDKVKDSEHNPEYTTSKGKRKSRLHDNEDLEAAEVNGEQLALEAATAERYPGLDERLRNIEAHLALRYVPTPPRTLLARLKYLEDHIVRLEKEYPPWAALHFNQPNRGWPAPPRATPIIVPPQFRSAPPALAQVQRPAAPAATNVAPMTTVTAPSREASSVASSDVAMPPPPPPTSTPKSRRATSSLQQAILDKLEVQRAMSELNNARGT